MLLNNQFLWKVLPEEGHYTESTYGLYKLAEHILAMNDRTWYIPD